MATHAEHVAKSSKEGEGKFDLRLPGNCVSHGELGSYVAFMAQGVHCLTLLNNVSRGEPLGKINWGLHYDTERNT
eukprot:13893700-Alexandrium_andersonii.AAC.1